MSPQEILALPMQENDANAKTVGEYLQNLFLKVWEDREGFSGKCPFGNSGWEYDLKLSIVKAGLAGVYDPAEDAIYDYGDAHAIISGAIRALIPVETQTDEPVVTPEGGMTPEMAAQALDNNQYGKEGSPKLFAEMKEAGLVAVFGCSDDLAEFRGAIDDEQGASLILLTKAGLLVNECDDEECPHFMRQQKSAARIKPKRGSDGWSYQTTIPHATFSILEGDKLYCRGIVFALKDV